MKLQWIRSAGIGAGERRNFNRSVCLSDGPREIDYFVNRNCPELFSLTRDRDHIISESLALDRIRNKVNDFLPDLSFWLAAVYPSFRHGFVLLINERIRR